MPNPSANMGVTQEARDAADSVKHLLDLQIDLPRLEAAFAKFERDTIAHTTSLTGAAGSGEVDGRHVDLIKQTILRVGIGGGSVFSAEDREEMAQGWAEEIAAELAALSNTKGDQC